jgi:transaldolase
MSSAASMKIKLFADGADRDGIIEMCAQPHIRGFTTNPTLMRKAGVTDYRAFARDTLAHVTDRPISFEVFADDFDEMERQATEIASWGPNVFVKIPVTDTRRNSTVRLIERLASRGVQLNVTAIMTTEQVKAVSAALGDHAPSYISVFAGRIADTGRDPIPLMCDALDLMRGRPTQELIWASPRELLNIVQADRIGCHIITVTNDLLKKLSLLGKDLDDFSVETVQMFYKDGCGSGFSF